MDWVTFSIELITVLILAVIIQWALEEYLRGRLAARLNKIQNKILDINYRGPPVRIRNNEIFTVALAEDMAYMPINKLRTWALNDLPDVKRSDLPDVTRGGTTSNPWDNVDPDRQDTHWLVNYISLAETALTTRSQGETDETASPAVTTGIVSTICVQMETTQLAQHISCNTNNPKGEMPRIFIMLHTDEKNLAANIIANISGGDFSMVDSPEAVTYDSYIGIFPVILNSVEESFIKRVLDRLAEASSKNIIDRKNMRSLFYVYVSPRAEYVLHTVSQGKSIAYNKGESV